MAIAAPSDEVIRLVEALGLRTKNAREVTLRMAFNEVVAVNTVEYVNGEQIDALASEFKERQYRLARWIPVEERLPKSGQQVLACVRLPHWTHEMPTLIETLDYDQGRFLGDDVNPRNYVTHWMPLPAPPEVK